MRIHLIETGRQQIVHLGSTAWSAGVHAAALASVSVGAWLTTPTAAPARSEVPEREVVYLLPTLPTAPVSIADRPSPPRATHGERPRARPDGTRPSGEALRDGDPRDPSDAAALAAIDSLARLGSMIFRIGELDRVAERDPFSAAPAYPPELQRGLVEGDVAAEWIVDATGRADTATFRVVWATHPRFADAVRAALPLMHFRPAETMGRHVGQMVRQEFRFRLTLQPPAAAGAP